MKPTICGKGRRASLLYGVPRVAMPIWARSTIAPPGREWRGVRKKRKSLASIRQASGGIVTPHYLLRQAGPADYALLQGCISKRRRSSSSRSANGRDRVVCAVSPGFKPEQAHVIHSDGADIGGCRSRNARGTRPNQIHIIDCYRTSASARRLITAGPCPQRSARRST